LVRETGARLDLPPADIGVVRIVLSSAEQIVVEAGGRFRKASLGRAGPAAARDHHSVIAVACSGDDSTRLGVNGYRLARIIERRIEDDHVSPQRLVGNHDGVAESVIDGELLVHFPGILRVGLIAAATEDGVGTLTKLRIAVEQPQRGVRHRVPAGWAAGAVVGERKLPVLVVGAGWTGADIDLVIVVFTRPLEVKAELHGMAALYPGQAVAQGIHGTGGVRRVRPAIQAIEALDIGGRNAGRDQLSFREDVGVINPDFGSIQEVGGVDRNIHIVQTYGGQGLIHQGR